MACGDPHHHCQEHEEGPVSGDDGPGRVDHPVPEPDPDGAAGGPEQAEPGAGREEGRPPAGLLLQLPERLLLPPVAGQSPLLLPTPPRPHQDQEEAQAPPAQAEIQIHLSSNRGQGGECRTNHSPPDLSLYKFSSN